jgi:predicted transcriptional regulator
MTLEEIKNILDADVIVGGDLLRMEVEAGFSADLMSDVLAFAKEGSILLTGLTNPLVVRTADTLGLRAIIFVRGKRPSIDAVNLANDKNIPLLATKFILFESSGRLFAAGMRGSIQKVGEAS